MGRQRHIVTCGIGFCLLLGGIWSSDTTVWAVDKAPPSAADLEFFEKEIRPLLVNQCFNCHSTDQKQRGGLLVDSLDSMLEGGDNGPAIVPGDPDESLLIQAISYQDTALKMPPKGKLKEDEIAALTRWVEMGAPWPAGAGPKPKGTVKEEFNLEERAKFWSFQPLKRAPVPSVGKAEWPKSDVDRFILAALEAKGLSPAPETDKRSWLRRVTFDLIGLPPTPDEIDGFLADETELAYERVVDRLLDSPQYGERWGRHWLDLVRFAETQGHEFDYEIPNAWRYRDYIIRAFNADIPYDQLVLEHLAGDLLPNPRRHPTERFNESVIGTGFYWLGEGKHSPVDVRAEEGVRVDNQIDVLSKTFLAMTVSCARCHDHKFDPISTKDYYALFGFFQSSRLNQAFIDDPAPWEQRLTKLSELRQSLAATTRTPLAAVRDQQLKSLVASLQTAGLTARTTGEATTGQDASKTPALLLAELEAARQSITHPWYALAHLVKIPDDQFTAARQTLGATLEDLALKAQQAQPDAYDVATFDGRDYGDWFVTGHAFGKSPIRFADAIDLEVTRRSPLRQLAPGMAHSGALSPRLRGVLRSPTFTLDRNHLWIRMAGQDTRVRLIIDEFHLIQDPIYGGLAISPGQADKLAWQEMNVSMWQGHRAYLEFIDDNDGFVAVDRIVLANGGPPGEVPSATSLAVVRDETLKSAADLQSRMADLTMQGLAMGQSPALEPESPAVAELALWLYRDNFCGTVAAAIQTQPAVVQDQIVAQSQSLASFEGALPVPNRAVAMCDGTPENERVFIRGNHKTLGDEVPRRLLEVLQHEQEPITEGSGRLELARRIIAPTNPLTSRVIVNRIWQHHFGEGLVRSPDDFGLMGQEPTHPELLDYLALQFMDDGWSIKRMHRRLLLTSSYRMSSQGTPAADEADPQNKLLHKFPILRLEAEIIRDSILAVSGTLQKTQFGPGVLPHLTPYMNGRGRPASGPVDGDGRRSIYLNVRRNFLTPMLQAFDYPTPFTTMGRRTVSNVPAQALCLMNNQFVVQQAERWAQRMASDAERDRRQCLTDMYVTAFGREPDPSELEADLAFLDTQIQLYPPGQQTRAWADLCHVLFNVKEFIFLK